MLEKQKEYNYQLKEYPLYDQGIPFLESKLVE
jgi:hypothetical protein